jgi:hypothetical protein
VKSKPRKPAENLGKITGQLYQFGLNFCAERGIPVSWLRLYNSISLHTDQELFSDGFYEVERPSFAEYSRRRYHIRLIPVAVGKEYHITWSTPRVWLEAPSVDDLCGFFPGWSPSPRNRNKDITLNAVAPLPRLLLALYTMPKNHSFKLSQEHYDPHVDGYRCIRCGYTSEFRSGCLSPDVYPVPLSPYLSIEPLFLAGEQERAA